MKYTWMTLALAVAMIALAVVNFVAGSPGVACGCCFSAGWSAAFAFMGFGRRDSLDRLIAFEEAK